MTLPKRLTVAAMGQTGAGKSEFLNAYLQKAAFKVCDDPDSCTMVTSADENLVLGILRTGIDTQGIDDTQGVDAEHVQQMVSFLKDWDHGVNVFVIVINVHADKFDQGTRKLIKLIHQFFNNPRFWDQVCIIFTKCFHGIPINKEVKKTRYREEVLKLVRECQGADATRPQLPVFFIDSPMWRTDQDTADELTALHAFVCKMDPLPTHDVIAPDVRYLRIERENRAKILVNTEIIGDENEGQERIETYEDQEREKRTAYDGKTVTYSDWKGTRRWEVRARSSVHREEVTECVNQNCEAILGPIGGGGGGGSGLTGIGAGAGLGGAVAGVPGAIIGGVISFIGGMFGGGREVSGVQVVGHKVTKTFCHKERLVKTDFDGKVSYGDWQIIREWAEEVNSA
jgi:GTP-binding protein EngB required for normal cell division